jgi:hypothetical protein
MVIAIESFSGAFVFGNAPNGELVVSTGDLAFAIPIAKQMLYARHCSFSTLCIAPVLVNPVGN